MAKLWHSSPGRNGCALPEDLRASKRCCFFFVAMAIREGFLPSSARIERGREAERSVLFLASKNSCATMSRVVADLAPAGVPGCFSQACRHVRTGQCWQAGVRCGLPSSACHRVMKVRRGEGQDLAW